LGDAGEQEKGEWERTGVYILVLAPPQRQSQLLRTEKRWFSLDAKAKSPKGNTARILCASVRSQAPGLTSS
jgi:hypothetical protein